MIVPDSMLDVSAVGTLGMGMVSYALSRDMRLVDMVYKAI